MGIRNYEIIESATIVTLSDSFGMSILAHDLPIPRCKVQVIGDTLSSPKGLRTPPIWFHIVGWVGLF
jgi:hypothetical protein